ncbi:MAG: hypothetical protein COS14_11055 [Bacteroidetes bacterium CG02_land_8_20_14_3_00_31_25]|nr:MAG: hypothetical protein COS14_11055 [Bacteroidetes bacterium CG02_land_8_20_14_3_00_31_25]PIY07010.1 MAG: hypothetical protein COZ21_01975 [Bacteroidetes bacterium CG_4_10_14_3_um_filter_31_20]
MKTKFNFLTVFCFIITPVSVLVAQSQFSRVFYHDTHSVRAYSIVKTFDNDFLLAGEKNHNPLVLKMDTLGNILWNKTYGSQGTFFSLTRTDDSCFVFAGNIFNTVDSASNVFCVKVNATGDTLWTKEINMGVNDYAYSIQQTNDKGYILTGFTSTDIYNYSYYGNYYLHSRIIIVRLDSSGNLMWGKIISGGNFSNNTFSIKQIPDSGFVATGYVTDTLSSSSYTKSFLLKLSPTGNVSWFKKHDWNTSPSYGFDVNVTDSGLICYFSIYNNSVVLKTDFSGNVIWSNQYNVFSYFGFYNQPFLKMHPSSDHGFILTTGMVLLKIDSTGNLAWTSNYWIESISDCIETADTGFIVLGNGPMYITKYSGQPEIAILKTDSIGYVSQCFEGSQSITPSQFPVNMLQATFTDTVAGTVKMQYQQIVDVPILERSGCVDVVGKIKENQLVVNAFNVFPNPSNGLFQITFSKSMSFGLIKIGIFNTIGQKIYESDNSDINGLSINLNKQSDGIYFIQVMHNGEINSLKIIINKKD